MADEPEPAQHFVFAHYMVCFATYGESVEGYEREMREARGAGIDGFALNCGAWQREPHYPRRTGMIFEAARRLGDGFKLFFSADGPPSEAEVVDMLKTYARHPNHLTRDGRPVLSTFAGRKARWREGVFAPLEREGIRLFFVPFFYPEPVTELPDGPAAAAHVERWAKLVDGMFLFGAAGLPEEMAASNAAMTRALRRAGRLSMASYTPHYWGIRQPDRRYYETRGGEGTEVQWRSIIDEGPEWVEIVTWNDWGESSYVSPAEAPWKDSPHLADEYGAEGFQKCHAGYLALTSWFIEWYKTGARRPVEREGLFYFYRTHPKDARATKDPRGPVGRLVGDVEDVAYVTTLLKGPAEIVFRSGGEERRGPAPAGLSHRRLPFEVGAQAFALVRDGRTVASAEGPAIEAEPEVLNFIPASGFVPVE